MTATDHSPPVFICGHRKSGTSVVLNLFDGHSALATYPVDLALLYAYFPDFLSKQPDAAARRERLRRILFEDAAGLLAKRGAADSLDLARLERLFFRGLGDAELGKPGALIARLLAAFQEVSGQDTESRRHAVVKETSVEIYADEILEWFPDAKFLQIIRDPRDNFAALAAGVHRHYAQLGEDHNQTLASLLNRARIGFRIGRANQHRFGPERYRCLRFEDIMARPEDTMHDLAGFLEIPFESCLLRPTILGRPTAGNNYDGQPMFEVSAANVGRWHERISDDDAKVIEFLMADEMAIFGYEAAYPLAEQARAAAEFYKWQNYRYFYSDRFA